MFILELQQQIEVETPKGKGRIVLVTDYGTEIEKVFTVILYDNGQFWEFTNDHIKATKNMTMGRGKWDNIPTSGEEIATNV